MPTPRILRSHPGQPTFRANQGRGFLAWLPAEPRSRNVERSRKAMQAGSGLSGGLGRQVGALGLRWVSWVWVPGRPSSSQLARSARWTHGPSPWSPQDWNSASPGSRKKPSSRSLEPGFPWHSRMTVSSNQVYSRFMAAKGKKLTGPGACVLVRVEGVVRALMNGLHSSESEHIGDEQPKPAPGANRSARHCRQA